MVFVAMGAIVAGMAAVGTVVDTLIRRHRRTRARGTAWADPHGQSRWQVNASGDAAASAQSAPPPSIPGNF